MSGADTTSSFEEGDLSGQNIPLVDEDEGTFKARTVTVFAIDFVYVALFFGFFTEMGYGATVFRFLSAHHAWASPWLTAFGTLFLFCYVADVRLWDGSKATAGAIIMGIAGLCLAVGMLFSFQAMAWLPLGFFLLFQPMLMFLTKDLLYPDVHIKHFMRSMMVVTMAIGLMTFLATGIFYSSNDFWWGDDSRRRFIQVLTDPTGTTQEQWDKNLTLMDSDTRFCDAISKHQRELDQEICESGDGECTTHNDCPCDTCAEGDLECYCLAAFLLWGSSAVAAFGLLVYGLFFQIMARANDKEGSNPTATFVAVLIGITICVWMAGTLMGTSMKASGAVESLAMILFLEIFFILSRVMGTQEIKASIMSVSLVKRGYEIGSNAIADWLKGCFILLFLPFFFIGLVLSALNQTARKMGLGRKLEDDEQASMFTKPYADFVGRMKNDWEWSSVLYKAMMVGILYFILSVGVAKISVVFLSWLNEALEGVDLFTVCIAYLAVGEIMFLNPLCPATPVYLTGGVIVVRAAERLFAGCEVPSEDLSRIKSCQVVNSVLNRSTCGVAVRCETGTYGHGGVGCQNVTIDSCFIKEGYEQAIVKEPRDANMLCFCPDLHGGENQENFWYAILFAAFVTFILKQLAIFLEQVAIGMTLGQKLIVRQFVQINSPEIKAIKLILDTPGLNAKKCAILLGGPDWPTSVLTGILRLNVLSMLIGSSPFFFLNTPTVMGGAFQLRTAESDMWSTLGIVGFAMAAMTQSTAGVFCWYYIFDVSEKRRDELDAMEDDQEVLELDRQKAERAAVYKEVSKWEVLPGSMKMFLVLGTICETIWMTIAIFQGSSCWESVQVSSPLSGPPLFAGIDSAGQVRDKTIADWLSFIKSWDYDCTYPKAQNPICTDYPKQEDRPHGLGWLALAFMAVGCVCCWIFSKWGSAQVEQEMKKRGDVGGPTSSSAPAAVTTGNALAGGEPYTPPQIDANADGGDYKADLTIVDTTHV